MEILCRLLLIAFAISPVVANGQDSSPSKGPAASKRSDETVETSPNPSRYEALESLARGLYYLESMYFDADKVKPSDMMASALKGVVGELDPHTVFMPKKAFNQLTTDTQGKFGGVGIIVAPENGKLIIVTPVEDSPADKAGVKAGDEILAIDGVPVKDSQSSQAVDKMRGEIGSTVGLTLGRKGAKAPIEVKLRRALIKVKSVRYAKLDDNVHYFRISNFQEDTAEELDQKLKQAGTTIGGVILDMRDNPGGLLDQAVKVSDLFIESGLIVSTVGRNHDRVEREFAHKRGTYSGFPMIVLVNEGTASASEIVAGALQDHERALILGKKTFGKGSVQTLISLPDGSGLKLTVARYFTPKDRSIQAKGIEPDITVPANAPTIQTSSPNGSTKRVSEADLERHIAGEDLSDLSANSGLTRASQKWPDNLRGDFQLVTAFTYLKGLSRFLK
jgi:carboxyl-terminal processing protease